jgi:hypothetical protein
MQSSKLNFILLIVFVCYSNFTSSQEAPKKISISDISVFTGYFDAFSYYSNMINPEEIRKKSNLFHQHYPSFENTSNSGNHYFSTRLSHLMVGLDLPKFNSKRQWKSQIRVGISYQNFTLNAWNGYYSHQGIYDTLLSSNNSSFIIRDTIRNNYLQYELNNELLGLDIAWTARKKFKNRWHLYSGIGMNIATTISSNSRVLYSDHFIYIMRDEWDGHPRNHISNFSNESLSGESVNNLFLYIPAGIEFQLGKDTREILKNLNLCIEVRPSLNLSHLKGYQTTTNTGFMNQIGLRFSL